MKHYYVFFSIGIIFTVLFLYITKPYNLAASPDSISYIEVARNFAEGKGIVDTQGELVNHWPPIYPVLLGFSAFVSGLNVLDVGIYFNLFFILLYGVLFFFILKKLKIGKIFRVTFLILLLFSIPTTEFLFFLSDGLFVTILTLVLFILMDWIKAKSNINLLLAGLFSGFLLLTRYAGIGFVVGFALYILLSSKSLMRKGLLQLFIYLFPIGLLVLAWAGYTLSFESNVVDRTIALHFIEFSKVKFGFSVIYHWFVGNIGFAVVFIGLILLFLYRLQQEKYHSVVNFYKSQKTSIALLLLPFITYLSFLVFSISFFDSHTSLDYRILMPIYPFMLLLLALFVSYLVEIDSLKKVAYSFLVVLMISVPLSSIGAWQNHYNNGRGFTGKIWKNSEAITYIQQHNDLDLFTNGIDAVRFFTSIPSDFFPRKFKPNVRQSNHNYIKEIQLMKTDVQNKTKQILYLDKITWRGYLMSKEELLKEFEDFDIIYFEDGFLIE